MLAMTLISQTFFLCLLGLPLSSLARSDLQVSDSQWLVRMAEIAVDKGCYGCHTSVSKRVGPPYRDIASKYERKSATVSMLAKKIKNGGTGVWGLATMPPSPVTEDESEILARWILNL